MAPCLSEVTFPAGPRIDRYATSTSVFIIFNPFNSILKEPAPTGGLPALYDKNLPLLSSGAGPLISFQSIPGLLLRRP